MISCSICTRLQEYDVIMLSSRETSQTLENLIDITQSTNYPVSSSHVGWCVGWCRERFGVTKPPNLNVPNALKRFENVFWGSLRVFSHFLNSYNHWNGLSEEVVGISSQ